MAFQTLKDFEPFCWFGHGYCRPSAKIIEDPELYVGAKTGTKHFPSESNPAPVSFNSMRAELNPNLDNLLVLTLAIVIACFTTIVVGVYVFGLQYYNSIRESENSPERPQSEPIILFTNVKEDDKLPAPESPISMDANKNAATANETSRKSSYIDAFCSGWLWESRDLQNNNNNAAAPIPLERTRSLSIPEIRKKAVIERVPSTEVGPTVFPRHFVTGNQITARSLHKLLNSSNDPILVFHQIPRTSEMLYENVESLQLETIIRLCGIPHVVVPDANRVMEPWLSYGRVNYIGIKNCLEFLKTNFPSSFQSCQVPTGKIDPARPIKILTECDLHWLETLVQIILKTCFKVFCTAFRAVLAWRSFYSIEGNCLMDFNIKENESVIREDLELHNYMHQCHQKFDGRNPDYIRLEMEKDLETLSASLGNKDFFVGESMTILDCSIFAELAQFMWEIIPNPTQFTLKRLIQKHDNLVRYCTHIRKHLWKDWDSELLSRRESSSSGVNLGPISVDFIEASSLHSTSESEHEVVHQDQNQNQPQQQNFLMDKIYQLFTASKDSSEDVLQLQTQPSGEITPSNRASDSGIIPSVISSLD